MSCARNKKCRCTVIYTAYKAACEFPGCSKLPSCVDSSGCGYTAFLTSMAYSCYSLRNYYIVQGGDNVYPTRKDHPEARNQALNKYLNCKSILAQCR